MNWDLIFWNALYTSINAAAAGYCIVAAGLNVHVGYTGLLNFGQAGFAAVGAYAFSIPIVEYGWSWYWALPLMLVCSVALALLMGVPTLRLRADYLAIVTIAIAEIIRLFLNSTRFTWLTGGTDGRNGWTNFFEDLNPLDNTARFDMGAQSIDGYRLFMMIVGWGIVVLVSVLIWAVMRSPWGRVLKSIREDEEAARALGKNVLAFKMQSLVLGGVIGSIGGLWISAQKQSAQSGEFATTLTFFAFLIIVIGGLGRVKGPIVGTIIFFFVIQLVDNVLEQATRNDITPDWLVDSSNFGVVKYIVAGSSLALLVVFRPQGIFGDKREQVFDVR
ncbi:MAG TPA: branched-chain amino acid ABC transporter permease [Ilumatobacteraceae bacterium]|nr:branched-chain amino acid ABC transporter permease [Ilumatobacteraceae bacterium]